MILFVFSVYASPGSGRCLVAIDDLGQLFAAVGSGIAQGYLFGRRATGMRPGNYIQADRATLGAFGHAS